MILLAHNPDFAEDRPDGRVGLVLSGHTHGGQVYLRGMGSTWLPSKYGDKYRHGLVQGPASVSDAATSFQRCGDDRSPSWSLAVNARKGRPRGALAGPPGRDAHGSSRCPSFDAEVREQ